MAQLEPLLFLWDFIKYSYHCHIREQTPPKTILCVKHLRDLLIQFLGVEEPVAGLGRKELGWIFQLIPAEEDDSGG